MSDEVQIELSGLNELAIAVHEHAKAQGFWQASDNVGEKIALIHSEISEALEEYRTDDGHGLADVYVVKDAQGNDKPEGFPIELADAIIRILDLAGFAGVDIDEAMKLKIEYNYKRPRLHGRLV